MGGWGEGGSRGEREGWSEEREGRGQTRAEKGRKIDHSVLREAAMRCDVSVRVAQGGTSLSLCVCVRARSCLRVCAHVYGAGMGGRATDQRISRVAE